MSRRKQAKPRAFLKLGEDPEECPSLEISEEHVNDNKYEVNITAEMEIKSDELTKPLEQQSDQILRSSSASQPQMKVSQETSVVYTKFDESTSNDIIKNTKDTNLDTPITKTENDCASNISMDHVGESDNEDREYLNDEEYTEDAEEDDLHSLDSFYSDII